MLNSKFFKRSEFACHCGCGFDTVDAELLEVLNNLRAYFNAPVKITSASRCRKHNDAIGGRSSSQHLLSKAADIVVLGVEHKDVSEYLSYISGNKYGIGSYDNFTHIDVRSTKARWQG